ncbi:unnamed protein product [Auanema sp. JU1783]|nr:unnamed protein product [Auanema sp. JU1783]
MTEEVEEQLFNRRSSLPSESEEFKKVSETKIHCKTQCEQRSCLALQFWNCRNLFARRLLNTIHCNSSSLRLRGIWVSVRLK